MERTVSATEARIRFGEWMRRAVEQGEAIVVQKGGQPYAVILSFEAYQRLQQGSHSEWQDTLLRMRRLRQRLYQVLGDQPLTPPPEEVIRQMREERDERLGLP